LVFFSVGIDFEGKREELKRTDRTGMKVKEYRKPEEKKSRVRALLLLSGGLDSILAGKVLEDQGVEIVALTFKSQFFGPREAIRAAEEQNWPLVEVDITEEAIQVVEKPRYGYGKNMNPCIDCHGQMVRIAGQLLDKYQADFVATGEVLGERPKSQNRQALGIVEKLGGLKGLVLRPLSARLLPVTIPEEKGLVDRERLLDISGRSRKRQMELAEKYGIKEYPTPAGGCLLADPGFSQRLRKLMEWRGRLLVEDIRLIKSGRLFFEAEGIIVIGRDEKDNEKIRKSILDSDIIITTTEGKGPLTAVRLKKMPEAVMGEGGKKIASGVKEVADEANDMKTSCQVIRKAALLTIRYSKVKGAEEAGVIIAWKDRKEERKFKKEEWEQFL